MQLPESVWHQAILLLSDFCQMRVPESIQHQYHLAVRVRKTSVTLYECLGPRRFSKSSSLPAAQFRYDPDKQVWSLYWADRQLRWHLYEGAKPTPDIVELIAEVHADHERVFFK